LSTDNELVRNVLLAVLASLAKLEREKISQRTKAGLERARANGKILGRPRFSDGDREKLRRALHNGASWHAVSVATKIPYSTVKKHARALGYKPGQRRVEPPAAVTKTVRTNFSGMLTLKEALARLRAGENDGASASADRI
jgi:DNA invertase Pin-like site-specific DNA recombinase